MAIQSLEQFQSTFGSAPIAITLEQFGKDAVFYLKPLSSADRDNFEASVVGIDGARNLQNLRARLVALCWCDEDGKPIGSLADMVTSERSASSRAIASAAMFERSLSMPGGARSGLSLRKAFRKRPEPLKCESCESRP